MKIKPLIKTHWVASQNPLTVPLAGLQRIVFRLPGDFAAFDFRSDPDLQTEIPHRSKVRPLTPSMAEIQEIRVHSYALQRDLFWNIFSGHDLLNASFNSFTLQTLAQSIEFHFEDGSSHSLPGIFRRPQFPRFLDPKYYLQDPSCNWERALKSSADDLLKHLKIKPHFKKNDDLKKSWIVVLEILAWALQRQRQVGDLEVLWCPWDEEDFDELSARVGYPLDEIEFHKERPLVATVQADPQGHRAVRIRLWEGSEMEVASGILRLHATEAAMTIEHYFSQAHVPEPQAEPKARFEATPEESKILQAFASSQFPLGLAWSPRLMTVETEAQWILRSLSQLEKTLGRSSVLLVNHTLISGREFKPFLKFRESEGSFLMTVCFQMESYELEHMNFPSSLWPCLAPFQGGMDFILGLDRKEAASRQAAYRAQDMLLLRHQGLALFCLFEMINWILGKPLSSGEEIGFTRDFESPEFDSQFDQLVQYLQDSIPPLLGKPGLQYKNLVSTRAQGHFTEMIERLFQALSQDRSLIFNEGQILEIRNVQSQVLPVIRFLILHFIESSSGKFLLRTQSPLSENFKAALKSWTEPIVRSAKSSFASWPALWMDIGRFESYSVSLLFELMDLGFDVELNEQTLSPSNNPFEFIFSVRDAAQKEDANWFDLHPEIFFNGKKIAAEEVKLNFGQGQAGFIEYQGQVYRIDKKLLPSLKSLQRFWKKIKGLQQTSLRGAFGDKVYRLEKSQALELLMLRAQGFEVRVEGEWKRIFDFFENGLGTEKVELPAEIKSVLLPHQSEGVQWLHDLYELKLGAILADEMGLGKTFQVLSFLSSLHQKQQLGACLIVVPTSLVYNWLEEKKKFAPDLPMRIYHSAEQAEVGAVLKSKEPIIVVATYGLLIENTAFFESKDWNVLTFDEAQNLKNIMSMRSVAARKLRAKFKVCVTGTPMENNYLEFYSLCDLVVPGCLGRIDDFRKEYVNREVRSESLRELRLISRPLLLRRTKAQVRLNLPQKTTQRVVLPFAPQQKEIYKKMAMTFSRQVEQLIEDQGERKAQIAMFSALMRLRQICSDPAAVPGVIYHEQPAKVEHFLEALQEHLENNESVVVFTQFLSTLRRLEKELIGKNIPTSTLQGSVSAKERIRLISEFQNREEPGVMLMTLKTGGVGLNLTKASVVYHLEPWWNPAVENQATDRAHRMGQTKEVKVFNLLIEGSLEERIADLKIKKQDSFDRLFNMDETVDESSMAGSYALSREDFIYLLK